MVQRHIDGLDMKYDMSSGGIDVARTVKPPTPAYHPTPSSSWVAPSQYPTSKESPRRSPPTAHHKTSRPLSQTSTPSRAHSFSLSIPHEGRSRSRPGQASDFNSDAEKKYLEPPRSFRTSRASIPDPEKASYSHRSMRSSPSSNLQSHHSTVIYEEDDDELMEHDPRNHAVWILAFLSALSPVLTTAICIYTIFLFLAIIISSPICYAIWRQRLFTTFSKYLVPPLHFQLGLIYSPYDLSNDPDPAFPPGRNTPMLILVNVFAPIVALCVAVAAWVAASFWLFSKILGNPNNNNNNNGGYRDEDRSEGLAAALGVRNFWESYLLRGLR